MKYIFCVFCLSVILLLVSKPDVFAAFPLFLNRVEGQIFDEAHHPVGDMYVELLDEVGSSLSTKKATSIGRFSFAGLSAGSFRVRVLPSGKNFLEQTKEIQFTQSVSGRNDDIQFVEFYLRIDKRAANVVDQASPEAVFVQDISADARKLYRSAVERLEKKDDKGLEELESAIDTSPYYFDALSRLGKEYVIRKNYEKAYPYLIRAIDQNARSYSSYYALAFAFYQLNQIPAAVKAAEACTVIRAESVEAHVLYGTLLRISGSFQESEKELRKASLLEKNPNAEIHWQFALLFNRLGRNREAADELEIFLKIAPDAANKKEIRDLINKLRVAKQS